MIQQTMDSLKKIVRGQSKKHPRLMIQLGSAPDTQRIIANMMQDDGPFKNDYAPQSGAIFGILKQMKEEFENNLKKATDDEATAAKAYDELEAAKSKEITSLGDQIDSKTAELAKTKKAVA